MKVALTSCSSPLPPIGFGGSERVVYYLICELEKLVDLTVYSPTHPDCELKRWIKWDGDISKFPVQDFDIIQNCCGGAKFDCNHAVNYILGPEEPKRNIVAVSKHQGMGRGFKSWKYVYHGTDINYFKYKSNKQNYFLYFSRIYPGKGPHIALELQRKLGFELIIAGEDKICCDNQLYVAQIKKMCRDQGVLYLGRVKNEEAVELLQNARALLFPVIHGEAFGLVAIEALSCGTPVITGARGALVEIIKNGETGFLCETMNDFEQAIKNIDQISTKSCREDAKNRWSSKVMAMNFLKLYEKVIAGECW